MDHVKLTTAAVMCAVGVALTAYVMRPAAGGSKAADKNPTPSSGHSRISNIGVDIKHRSTDEPSGLHDDSSLFGFSKPKDDAPKDAAYEADEIEPEPPATVQIHDSSFASGDHSLFA